MVGEFRTTENELLRQLTDASEEHEETKRTADLIDAVIFVYISARLTYGSLSLVVFPGVARAEVAQN